METIDNTTVHILDLRDRMVRIETKLDGHQESHKRIDVRLEKLERDTEDHGKAIAAWKVRASMLAVLVSGAVSLIGLLGDRFWRLFP